LDEDNAPGADNFAADEPPPDAQAAASERGEFVRKALATLSPPYREVVVLRHYEGLKFREIGEVLGIPEGTVKSRMAEAMAQLSKLLKHVNEEELCNRKTQTPEMQVL
jgi:RNA polymerase sigma-70 factor (ECF subfamily)